MELSLRGCDLGGEYRGVWRLHASRYGLHEPLCRVSEAVAGGVGIWVCDDSEVLGEYEFGITYGLHDQVGELTASVARTNDDR